MIILIDHENVNIRSIDENLLSKENTLFVFHSDTSLSAKSKQFIDDYRQRNIDIRMIRIFREKSSSGELDQQLAFILGTLVNDYPYETYMIISKDKAFQSLLQFAQNTKPTIQIKNYITQHENRLLSPKERSEINNALQKSHLFDIKTIKAVTKAIKAVPRTDIATAIDHLPLDVRLQIISVIKKTIKI